MLNSYRKKIDKIDKKISALLKERHQLVKAIGEIKHTNKMPVRDDKREEESIKKLLASKQISASEKEYIANIFSEIHRISRKVQ